MHETLEEAPSDLGSSPRLTRKALEEKPLSQDTRMKRGDPPCLRPPRGSRRAQPAPGAPRGLAHRPCPRGLGAPSLPVIEKPTDRHFVVRNLHISC